MSARLDRIGADWRHALKKAEEWTEKAKELERKYKEAENTEIHDLVHQAQLTPDQLAEVLKALKDGTVILPAAKPAENDPDDKTENQSTTEEETDDEE